METHFGFETVSTQEKTRRVRGVFDAVASRYDVMNDAMSFGLHRLWKRDFASSLLLRDGMRVLDLAGGTGDIAFLMHAQAALDITICDINEQMLRGGRNRAIDRNLTHYPSVPASHPSPSSGEGFMPALHWLCGNAESLPLPANGFDRCTIAFGIRNVTDIPAALREIYRILKPGGRFACLEFSPSVAPAMKPLYDRFSFDLIPLMGEWIADDRASYQYLVESIRRFPTPKAFAGMLSEAGFSQVSWRPLSGGVVAIHSGWKV